MGCALGHTTKAMECPSCSGTDDLEHWKWYKTRTSSKRVRALVQAHIDRVRLESGDSESLVGQEETT